MQKQVLNYRSNSIHPKPYPYRHSACHIKTNPIKTRRIKGIVIVSMFKIITFVPIKDAHKVRQAIGDAGAGVWGKYQHCSFSSKAIHPYEQIPLEIYKLIPPGRLPR